ncbi:MAG: hypothetical protein ACRCXM_16075 [Beijerinckiaceae bacterium]
MAKIEVIARTLGQLPDGSWLAEGETATIDEAIASHRWMARADGKPWPVEKPAKISTQDKEIAEKLAAALSRENELMKRLEETQRLLSDKK